MEAISQEANRQPERREDASHPAWRARARAALVAPGSPWPWIAIAVLAAVPHLHGIANPFVYDDWTIIPDNPYMVDPQAVRKIFSGSVASFLGGFGVSNYYRPMMHLFHYALYQLFGPRPEWFHLFCLALHVGVSLLAAVVVRRISGRQWVGVLTGLLFAVHPAHTEVVAWISCSPDLLSSMFSLLAIWLYLRSADVHGPRRALLALVMGISLLLAQLSKEIAVLVPLVMVAYESLVRGRSLTQQARKRWPEYAALGAATLTYLAAYRSILGGFIPVHRRTPVAWTEHLWTSVALFYRYLALLVWPMDLNSLRYYWPNRSPLEPVVLAGGVSLAAFLALGLWLYRRRAPEVLALPMYLLPLLPIFLLPYVSNVMLMIERAAYLPSLGFCWLAAAGLVTVAEKFGARRALLLAVIVLAGYTGRSAMRMYDWGDEIGLFQEGLVRAPDPFHVYLFQGEALLRHQRPVEAVASLREALRLRPGYAEIYNHLGWAYLLLRQPDLALRHYQRAGELWRKEGRRDFASRAWSNIGIVYESLGRNQEAIAAYGEALRLDPEFGAARNNLGFALLREGQVEEATRELRAAIAREPALWQAHANLGLAYAMRAQWDAALAALREAERLAPDHPEVHARIGGVHLARGETEAAQRRFWLALERDPQNARALAGTAALRAREAPP